MGLYGGLSNTVAPATENATMSGFFRRSILQPNVSEYDTKNDKHVIGRLLIMK